MGERARTRMRTPEKRARVAQQANTHFIKYHERAIVRIGMH